MDFIAATDALLARGITLQEIADALGVSYSAVRAARLPEGSEAYRRPRVQWQGALARLAQDRGGELGTLARQLRGEEA